MRLMERMFGSHHGGHHGTVGTTTKSIVVNIVTTVDSTFDKMNNVGDVRVRQHPLPQSVRDGACACCVQQMQWSASAQMRDSAENAAIQFCGHPEVRLVCQTVRNE